MSLSVTTDCASSFPASVLNFFGELSSFGIIPCGNTERLIRHALEPKSSKILSSLRLFNKPIVPAALIVAGHWFIDVALSSTSLLST